jgi:hypothetical protein
MIMYPARGEASVLLEVEAASHPARTAVGPACAKGACQQV